MAQQRSTRRSSGNRRTGGSSRRSPRARRSPTDHQEVEWQFDAAGLDPVEGWLRQHSAGSGLVVEPEREDKISDTYYDTEDWRFYRAGYALRVRKTGTNVEATMKSLSPADGNVRRRREITEPLGDDRPATLAKATGPVGARSRDLLGDQKMRPMFKISTRRQRFALLVEDASEDGPDNRVRVGEVALDASEIPLGDGKEAAHLSRVEVEAGAGTAPTPDLTGFVDEMQYALDLRPASVSKFETGLYATGLSPDGAATGPTKIGPTMTLGEVAFAVLRRQFGVMRAHEPGTRLGEDPEELHDMRVATRRMRAAIQVFRSGLPERAKWFEGELRWIAGVLGEVRDLDVQINDLEDRRAGDDEEIAEPLGKVVNAMQKRRTKARKLMLDALDSQRYERLETSFAEMLRRGPDDDARELGRTDGRDPAREPVTAAAPALLSRRYRKWSKAAGRLGEASSPEAFHDLRKKGKRLRYALEFLTEVYGKPARGLIKTLKSLQDDLGDHQDAIVAAATLRDLGTTTGGPRLPRGATFAMGVYTERYLREASDLRHRTLGSKAFRSLTKGKEWKELQRAMKDAAKRQGVS